MENKNKASAIKITLLYFLASSIFIWIYRVFLNSLFFGQINFFFNNNNLFIISWGALIVFEIISLILGCKSAGYIIKNIYAKAGIDNNKIIKLSSVGFIFLTGFVFSGKSMSYGKFDSSLLLSFVSFLIISFLYYYFTKNIFKSVGIIKPQVEKIDTGRKVADMDGKNNQHIALLHASIGGFSSIIIAWLIILLLVLLFGLHGGYFFVSTMVILAVTAGTYSGIILSTEFINKRYIIQNDREIINSSMIYLVIVCLICVIASQFFVLQSLQLNLESMLYFFIFTIVVSVPFYFFSKKYIKNNTADGQQHFNKKNNIKRNAILIFISVMIFLEIIIAVVFRDANKNRIVNENQEDTGLEYITNDSGCSFQYPKSFEFVTLRNMADILKSERIIGETKKTILELNKMSMGKDDIMLVERDNDNEGKNIATYSLLENRSATFSNYTDEIRTNQRKIDQNFTENQFFVGKEKCPGLKFIYNYENSQDKTFTMHRVIFDCNNSVFDFQFGLSENLTSADSEKYLQIYNDIINSFFCKSI